MKFYTFIPSAFLSFIFILLTMPVVPSDAQENMQLVIDARMNDKMAVERDFIVTEPYTVSEGHLVFEATEAKTNPSLTTVNSYADSVMEVELILGAAQKAPICFTARLSKDKARLYGFYLYPDGAQYIRLIETTPELKIKDLGKHADPISFDEPYRVKISAVDENLAMKTWPAAEKEPAEWQVQVKDANLESASRIGIEIQRSGTPGGYSAEIRALKVWIPKNK
ncbi:MAG: hypothetical protein HY360_08475 [Verrucomicrobia bacterium]|nr:hypothetical protein [Verrucomicrobiota bacterium]